MQLISSLQRSATRRLTPKPTLKGNHRRRSWLAASVSVCRHGFHRCPRCPPTVTAEVYLLVCGCLPPPASYSLFDCLASSLDDNLQTERHDLWSWCSNFHHSCVIWWWKLLCVLDISNKASPRLTFAALTLCRRRYYHWWEGRSLIFCYVCSHTM